MNDFGVSAYVSTKHHDTYPAIDPLKANLSGKVVLISGASKGIGKTTAIAMAQAGVAGLVLLARSDLSAAKAEVLAAKRTGQPLEVVTAAADVTNYDQVVAAVKKAEDVFGRLDIVVNNAGYINEYKLILDGDPVDWWHTWDVNVKGTYHLTRATLPLLIKSEGDRTIINLSSAAATVILPTTSSYSPSKLALLRFAEFVSAEYGDKGIISYSVHPGALETDMTAKAPDWIRAYFIDKLELPAHTIVWLAKERREWLAGRYVDCTWDMEEFLAKKEDVVQGDKLKARIAV